MLRGVKYTRVTTPPMLHFLFLVLLGSKVMHVLFIYRWCFGCRNPGQTARLSELHSNHGYRLQNNHRLDRKELKTIRIKRTARKNPGLENCSVSLLFSLGEKCARAVSQNSETGHDDSPSSATCEMLGAVLQMPVLHSCSATTSVSVWSSQLGADV